MPEPGDPVDGLDRRRSVRTAAPALFVFLGSCTGSIPAADSRAAPTEEPVERRDTAPELYGLGATSGVIDSHVHLAYYPVADELARAGIVAVVDLASPLEALDDPVEGLTVLRSGPMITPPGGYPTRSWGADGYGLECGGERECVAAVDRLVDAGAAIIKVPIGAGGPDHDDATLRAIVARAHGRHRIVAVHALDDASARRAAEAGADLLAHTPVEPLADDTVRAWSTRAVVSTLRAFGGSDAAVENLRRLHEAGATVLYGTDLGNTRTAGIDPVELSLLARAGLTPAEIRAAAVTVPARYFGML